MVGNHILGWILYEFLIWQISLILIPWLGYIEDKVYVSRMTRQPSLCNIVLSVLISGVYSASSAAASLWSTLWEAVFLDIQMMIITNNTTSNQDWFPLTTMDISFKQCSTPEDQISWLKTSTHHILHSSQLLITTDWLGILHSTQYVAGLLQYHLASVCIMYHLPSIGLSHSVSYQHQGRRTRRSGGGRWWGGRRMRRRRWGRWRRGRRRRRSDEERKGRWFCSLSHLLKVVATMKCAPPPLALSGF